MHYRWNNLIDIRDLKTPQFLSIAELDKNNAVFGGFTPGIRVDTNTHAVRAAASYKVALPPVFGMQPYFALEG